VNAHADTCLGPDDLRPRLWLDGPLTFGDINERVMSEFAALAPFGPGNPRPKFHTGPVAIVDGPRLLKDRHLKMSMKQNGRVLRAIQWNAAERNERLTAMKERVEIAYTIEENEYQGTKYVELRVEDFRDA
jgi:single-stranded-DNA-specific exonuclease